MSIWTAVVCAAALGAAEKGQAAEAQAPRAEVEARGGEANFEGPTAQVTLSSPSGVAVEGKKSRKIRGELSVQARDKVTDKQQAHGDEASAIARFRLGKKDVEVRLRESGFGPGVSNENTQRLQPKEGVEGGVALELSRVHDGSPATLKLWGVAEVWVDGKKLTDDAVFAMEARERRRSDLVTVTLEGLPKALAAGGRLDLRFRDAAIAVENPRAPQFADSAAPAVAISLTPEDTRGVGGAGEEGAADEERRRQGNQGGAQSAQRGQNAQGAQQGGGGAAQDPGAEGQGGQQQASAGAQGQGAQNQGPQAQYATGNAAQTGAGAAGGAVGNTTGGGIAGAAASDTTGAAAGGVSAGVNTGQPSPAAGAAGGALGGAGGVAYPSTGFAPGVAAGDVGGGLTGVGGSGSFGTGAPVDPNRPDALNGTAGAGTSFGPGASSGATAGGSNLPLSGIDYSGSTGAGPTTPAQTFGFGDLGTIDYSAPVGSPGVPASAAASPGSPSDLGQVNGAQLSPGIPASPPVLNNGRFPEALEGGSGFTPGIPATPGVLNDGSYPLGPSLGGTPNATPNAGTNAAPVAPGPNNAGATNSVGGAGTLGR